MTIEAGFNDIIKYKILGNYSDDNGYRKVEKSQSEFIKLIEQQQRRKRKIFLILSPYHPKLYIRIKQELLVILTIEKEFKRIAKENSVQIIGSYDPVIAGCSADEFYDGMHPNGLCMSKIVSK